MEQKGVKISSISGNSFQIEILMEILELHICSESLINQCQKFKGANMLEPGVNSVTIILSHKLQLVAYMGILLCNQIF